MLWQTLIHLTFIVSAIGIAAVDRMRQFTPVKVLSRWIDEMPMMAIASLILSTLALT